MSNFFVLLVIGGSLGWLATAWRREFGQSEMLVNIIAGALAGFSAGLLANGQGLYAGLNGFGLTGSVAGPATVLSLLSLLRRRRPR